MKTYSKLINPALAAVGLSILCTGCSNIITENMTENQTAEKYYNLVESDGLFRVYRSYELTEDILTNRNGAIIVEEVIGKCVDGETGAGVVLGGDSDNYYISYSNVKNVKTNDIICSYMIYNPDNNYEDDIMERYDYIIDSAE